MINFEFYNPTRVFFGKNTHKDVGKIISGYGYQTVMLHYGGGSVKKTGLYDEIVQSLNAAGIAYVDFGGAQPNPKLELVKQGAAICRDNQVELVLAVGGGSVIDSAKVIAEAAVNDGDPWDFFEKTRTPKGALPVGVVLTLAASGSEMSASAVITNQEKGLKRGFNSDTHRPLFSILNPALTFTVDKFQTGCGVVDIMMHTLERYFTKTQDVELGDRIAEGLLKSVIHAGKVAIGHPDDYEARATLMWAGSLSHNDTTGAGRDVFLTVHQLEHELSGMYDRIAHGAGLSVLFPAWAKYVYSLNLKRFCQYAVRVWNVEMDFEHPEKTALAGISATEDFFASLGMPVRLSALDVGDDKFDEMAVKCTNYGKRTLPCFKDLGKDDIVEIFKLAK